MHFTDESELGPRLIMNATAFPALSHQESRASPVARRTVMTKMMDSWYFMRQGFTRFRMEPDRDPQYLFGEKDRLQRNQLLASMEEESIAATVTRRPCTATTAAARRISASTSSTRINRQGLPPLPCTSSVAAYGTKEPFQTFFRELVLSHSTSDLHGSPRSTTSVQTPPKKIAEITQSEDIASVIGDG